MACVLAIAPDGTSRSSLDRLQRELSGHDVTVVASSADALARIDLTPPDLVVFPIALSPADRTPLVAKLRELSSGDDAQCRLFDALTEDQNDGVADSRWFYWFKPKPEPVVESTQERAARQAGDAWQRAKQVLNTTRTTITGKAALAGNGALRLGKGTVRIAKGALPIGKAALERGKAVAQRGKSAVGQAGRNARATMPEPSAVATWVENAKEPLRQWAPRIAVVGVLIAAGVTGRVYWTRARPALTGLTAVVTREPRKEPVAAAPATVSETTSSASRVGTLEITSEPPGAAVLLGGTQRGVTPLTIEGLPVGTHAIVLASDAGTVRRSVVIKPAEKTRLDAAIYSGWMALFSPIELEVSEQGRRVRLDEQSQVMLPPGRHELVFTNAAYGYRETRTVDIQPGETSRVSIPPPRSTLTVTATPGAQVWVDGARIGDAPVTDMPIDIGTREVVVRHPDYGERRLTVTATMAPARLDVDLTSPQPQ